MKFFIQSGFFNPSLKVKPVFSYTFFFSIFFFQLSCTQQKKPKAEKPNFLFILVDDLGYKDLGCYGSSFYETLHIDSLAASGVRFIQAYAACPVCSPTRFSIMTGQYPARTGNTDWFGAPEPAQSLKKKRFKNKPLLPAYYKPYMDLDQMTIAEALKSLGYKTFIAGKWHLGKDSIYWPLHQGFDINKGGYARGHPKSYFSPYYNPRLKDGPKGEYLTDRLANETIKFIRQNKDHPFFAYLAFYAVHTPLEARKDLIKKYQHKKDSLGLTDQFGKTGNEASGYSKVRLNQSLPVYAAMVEGMDQAAGKVLNTLKELGLDDHTIVIFFSDNGGLSTTKNHPTSNQPFRAGKGWLYEGGIREPLIIRWPGVTKPGTIDSSIVISTDFYPTILQMAQLSLVPKQHKDGISLTAHLKKGKPLTRKAIYWHYPHYGNQGSSPASAIRENKWKLIRWYGNPKNTEELFNLNKDLEENHNVIKKYPKVGKELSTKLSQWLTDMHARFPKPNPNYKVN